MSGLRWFVGCPDRKEQSSIGSTFCGRSHDASSISATLSEEKSYTRGLGNMRGKEISNACVKTSALQMPAQEDGGILMKVCSREIGKCRRFW
eukprot:6195588-Pleurochrysis_carterae.AAC.1